MTGVIARRKAWWERGSSLLVCAALLFGCNLWGYDLWAPDEPFFGEGAREMLVDGRWVVPYINGEVNTHKPPLFFWLIALFSAPFGGVLSLTARLPSMLAALGTIALTMRLGRLEFGQRTGLLAGAMLATTHLFWEKARWAQIDSLLCFLIMSSLTAFHAFRRGLWSGRKAGIVFWASSALAVLAKGPVGLLLPLGIAILTLAFDRQLGRWRSFAPVAGPIAFVAITGLWVIATLWEPDYSVLGALREHFVDRAIHGMHHERPFWYYAKVIPYALLPWSLLLPGAVWLAWRRRTSAADRFFLIAPLFVIGFFSISTEKRDLYILPAVPFLMLLSAHLVACVLGWREARVESQASLDRKWITVPQGLVGASFLALSVTVLFGAPQFGSEFVTPAALLGGVFGFGGGAIVVAATRGRALRVVQWTMATTALAFVTAVSFVYPALEPTKSGRVLADTIKSSPVGSLIDPDPILGLDLGNVPNTVNFYSNGIYFELISPDQLLARLEEDRSLYVLANEEALPHLDAQDRERVTVLYATRLSRKNLVFLYFSPWRDRQADMRATSGG